MTPQQRRILEENMRRRNRMIMRSIVAGQSSGGVSLPPAASYTEVGTLGVIDGAVAFGSQGGEKYGLERTVPVGGVWAKRLRLKVSAGTGFRGHRGWVYQGPLTGSSALLRATQETVAPTTGFFDLWFNVDQSPVFFDAGPIAIGVHNSANDAWMCVGSGAPGVGGPDTYVDGTSATFGTVYPQSSEIVISMPYSLTA